MTPRTGWFKKNEIVTQTQSEDSEEGLVSDPVSEKWNSAAGHA